MTLQNDVTIAYDRVAPEPAPAPAPEPAPEPAELEGVCEGGYVAPDSR